MKLNAELCIITLNSYFFITFALEIK